MKYILDYCITILENFCAKHDVNIIKNIIQIMAKSGANKLM